MTPTDYIVILKAVANARFRRPEDSMSFRAEVNGSTQSVTFYTRFTDEGLDAAVPHELMAECRCAADSMDAAIAALGMFASGLANLAAFVTNAAITPMTLYVAVDATPGLASRPFVQEFGEFDNGPLQQGRAIPIDEVGAVAALMGAALHVEAGWSTAAQHYALALTRWRFGSEPFVLTHLYTAAEALEKTVVLQEADKHGVAPDDLYKVLKVAKAHVGAYYRRTVVFQGDRDFMDDVRDISDRFEHGRMSVAEARERSSEFAPRLFKVIRECMLDRIHAPDDLRDFLLGDKYGPPLDPTFRKVVSGDMANLPDEIGPPGFTYPFLTWDTGLSSLAFDDDGELQASMAENFIIHTADGGGFALKGLRMFGRKSDPSKAPVEMKDVRVTYGPKADDVTR